MQRRGFLGGAGGLAALTLSQRAFALASTADPRIKRQYVDCPFGQLHFHVASPEAEAITAPPLVLLHQTALSGRMFDRILPVLATNRVAIAVDTPGYGESDRPAARPTLAGYGDAILDALTWHFDSPFDLLGYHTGAAIAADLAARREEVRRLVLVSMPYFDTARREKLLEQLRTPRPEESAYSEDGSHLAEMWRGSLGVRAEGQSLDQISRLVSTKTRAGRFGHWALLSAMEQDLTATLASIARPALVIAPHDGLQEQCHAAAKVIQGAQLIELPDLAYGLFDAQPQRLAGLIDGFLGR